MARTTGAGPKAPPLTERRVFVRLESGEEVAYYPERDQWRFEDGARGVDITLEKAVEVARRARRAWIFYGQPGGSEFDYKVRVAKGLEKVSDRTVHARLSNGTEIVRYDRAGKWYAEAPSKKRIPRQLLTITQAVEMALADPGTEVLMGRPGGAKFDALMKMGGRR